VLPYVVAMFLKIARDRLAGAGEAWGFVDDGVVARCV
jgi:hypothetical protein